MFNESSFKHLGGGRKGLFLLLRYMFIIAASYLLLFQRDGVASPSVALMIAAALATNVVFSVIPARYVFSWYLEAPLLVSDTLWVSWALHSTGAAGQEFFLLYFFVLFFAMLGESVGLLVLGSTLVSAANVYLEPEGFLWSPGPMLRIVFFYMVALFYGHVLGRIRHERNRADEGLAWARELEAKVAERTRELQSLYEQSREASRLKSEFIASISHELRTPLNVIIGYTDMLADEDAGDPERAGMLNGIRRASRTLLDMVDGMLDLRKLESGRMPVLVQPVVLPAFMEDLKQRERLPLATGVRLQWQVPSDLPVIETDSAKLTMILDNLLNNAIKFTAAGSITVRASHVAAESCIHLSVEDTGTGIAPESVRLIFEPFFRLENAQGRSEGGAGLGLAIVQRYVRLLGGEITVSSQPGVGTRFDLRIPLRCPAATGSVVVARDAA